MAGICLNGNRQGVPIILSESEQLADKRPVYRLIEEVRDTMRFFLLGNHPTIYI